MKQIFITFLIIVLLFGCTQNNSEEPNVSETSEVTSCYSGIDQTDSKGAAVNHDEYKTTGKVPHLSTHNGYSMSFYENGQIASEGLELNMQKNGIWIEYYPSGKIKSLVSYWNDQPDGIMKLFYENGNLKLEGYHFRKESPKYADEWKYDIEFDDTVGTTYLLNPEVYKHGKWNEYSEDGKLIKSTVYKMGDTLR